jgi:hypothetical protein
VARSIHEGARDLARNLSESDAYVSSRRERKKIEMLFAHLKRILKLDQLRLRSKRSSGRVPPRRHRPEPPQDGQASPHAGPASHYLRSMKANLALRPSSHIRSHTSFFNAIRLLQTLRPSEATGAPDWHGRQ